MNSAEGDLTDAIHAKVTDATSSARRDEFLAALLPKMEGYWNCHQGLTASLLAESKVKSGMYLEYVFVNDTAIFLFAQSPQEGLTYADGDVSASSGNHCLEYCRYSWKLLRGVLRREGS